MQRVAQWKMQRHALSWSVSVCWMKIKDEGEVALTLS